jgi:hypothetical protein
MPLIFHTRNTTEYLSPCPYKYYCWKGKDCLEKTIFTKEPTCYMPVEYTIEKPEQANVSKIGNTSA